MNEIRQYDQGDTVTLRSRCEQAVDGVCDCHPGAPWQIERRQSVSALAGYGDPDRWLYRVRNLLTGAARSVLDQELMSFDQVADVDEVPELDDEAICEAILARTAADLMPTLHGSARVAGVVVTIVEPVMPPSGDQVADRGPERGYLWQAVAGDFELVPARYGDAGERIPGGAQGGEVVASSRTSAAAALTNARGVLRSRAGA